MVNKRTEVRINGLMELIEFLNSVKNPGEWIAVDDKGGFNE